MTKTIQIIILAGGVGKRMNNMIIPKALVPLKGRPLVAHLLRSVKKTKLFKKPVIIIGRNEKLFKKILGLNYSYISQKKPLGTADAVKCAKDSLRCKFKNIMVLYGDHPLLSGKTIKKIVKAHLRSKNVLTMAVVKVFDFDSWQRIFYDWGRIIRDNKGKLKGVVELKDARRWEKEIKEVNPSFFCFEARWLWDNIDKIKNNNAPKEYYLPDLLQFAVNQNRKITTIEIAPQEALGVNTKEQLILASKLIPVK